MPLQQDDILPLSEILKKTDNTTDIRRFLRPLSNLFIFAGVFMLMFYIASDLLYTVPSELSVVEKNTTIYKVADQNSESNIVTKKGAIVLTYVYNNGMAQVKSSVTGIDGWVPLDHISTKQKYNLAQRLSLFTYHNPYLAFGGTLGLFMLMFFGQNSCNKKERIIFEEEYFKLRTTLHERLKDYKQLQFDCEKQIRTKENLITQLKTVNEDKIRQFDSEVMKLEQNVTELSYTISQQKEQIKLLEKDKSNLNKQLQTLSEVQSKQSVTYDEIQKIERLHLAEVKRLNSQLSYKETEIATIKKELYRVKDELSKKSEIKQSLEKDFAQKMFIKNKKVSKSEIKKQYKLLTRMLHPDNFANSNNEIQSLASHIFGDIRNSYDFFKKKYQIQ